MGRLGLGSGPHVVSRLGSGPRVGAGGTSGGIFNRMVVSGVVVCTEGYLLESWLSHRPSVTMLSLCVYVLLTLLMSSASPIAHLDMHHLVFGINFQVHSVSLTIVISIHLLIHFSTHLCHHPHSRHPSLLLSFTPGSKPTFSTNPSHRRFLLPTRLPHDNGTAGLEQTYHAHHFILSFTF